MNLVAVYKLFSQDDLFHKAQQTEVFAEISPISLKSIMRKSVLLRSLILSVILMTLPMQNKRGE